MKIRKILEILEKIGSSDIHQLLFCYSSKNFWRASNNLSMGNAAWKPRENWLADRKCDELDKFYTLLNYLKRNGFVSKKKTSKNAEWVITPKGKEKLISPNIKESLEIKPLKLGKTQKDDLKVIVFDIPETYRKIRNWLRISLINFGFRKLQKSVWIGDNLLPEDFFNALKRLKILKFVHIFSIKDSGSIKI